MKPSDTEDNSDRAIVSEKRSAEIGGGDAPADAEEPFAEWSVLELLPVGCYVATPDRRIAFMNAKLREELGDAGGRLCYEVLGGRSSPCPDCIFATGLGTYIVEGRTYCHTFERDGGAVELLSSPIPGRGGMLACVTGVVRAATEPGQAEARVLASESRYRDLFNSVRQGIFVTGAEGEITDCNRALLEILGYDSRKELRSLDFTDDLFADREDVEEFTTAIARDGAVRQIEVELERRDASKVQVALSGRALRSGDGTIEGYEVLAADISYRKVLEREFQQQASFLANVIDASVDGIIFSDMDGLILVYNRGAESILGFTEDEAVGKMNARQLYPKGMARKVRLMIQSDEHGGADRLEGVLVELRRKDGSAVRVNLSAAIVLDDKGAKLGVVAILVDVTERLAMEGRLRDARENLMRAEKLAAMGRLTSQIAHEINNPLYGIMNTLELLRPVAEPGTRRRRLLEIAVQEGTRLAELLRKMLILSKPEQEPRQPTDINLLLEDLLLFVERQMRVHSVKIDSTFDDSLPAVQASPAQLRQVFLNVLRNAREAMTSGGTLTVRTRPKGEAIEITIADTGVGIREEHLERIFEAFFTTKGKLKGVGLGLSVCYTAIKDHGGDIRVESTPGKGTTFVITLPFHRPPMLEPSPHGATPERSPRRPRWRPLGRGSP